MKPPRPHWQENVDHILVGVEQEFFIFGSNGETPTLEKMGEFFRFLGTLGYRLSSFSMDGLPQSANFDYEFGYVSVKNDFCTHIIEFALPPVSDPLQFSEIYLKTLNDIETALKSILLSIRKGSTLPTFPSDTVFIPGHSRLEWFRGRELPLPKSHLTHRFFTTMMCATQVHLNISSNTFYRLLPSLYALDVIVPLVFANGTNFNGEIAHCPRVIAWCQNFPEKYLAAGYPENIPDNGNKYEKMIANSADFQRDYTLITPRQSGSVEFRSACSQDSLESILQLIAFRIACVVASVNCSTHLIPDRASYIQAALTGNISSKDQLNTALHFNDVISQSGSTWTKYLTPVIEKLTAKTKNVA
jgi:gamma-glutamylcysteine synthetase